MPIASMMISSLASLVLPALLLGDPAVGLRTEAGLLAALPPNAIAAIHLPDPRALIASRETNRWVGFATDAEWKRLLGPLLAAVGDDVTETEVAEWHERVLGAMADSTGLVGFLAGDPSSDTPPTAGLILRGGEQSATLLRRFIGTDARTETIDGGQQVLLSAAGRAELYYEAEGLIMVLSTPTVDESKAVASQCLAALGAGELPALFNQAGLAARRRPGATFELAVNLGLVWDAAKRNQADADPFEKRLLESASSMEWIYGAGELGVGESAEWNLFVPFAANSLIGKALGFFGTANKSLLATAPANSISATVGAFDINSFTRWALDMTREISEEAHGEAMGALSAAKSAVGVDVLEDIIGPMKGQFLGFSSAATAEQGGSMMALTDFGTTTFVALTEDTDPLLDLFDSLIEMSGMGDAVSTEEITFGDGTREMELWRSDAASGLPITIGVGNGRLMISSDAGGSQSYLGLLQGKEGERGMVDRADLAKAVEAASGAIITIQPTVAFADALEGFGEVIDAMTTAIWITEEYEEEPMARLADTMGEVAALARQYFSGTTTTEVRIGDGIVQVHTQSR